MRCQAKWPPEVEIARHPQPFPCRRLSARSRAGLFAPDPLPADISPRSAGAACAGQPWGEKWAAAGDGDRQTARRRRGTSRMWKITAATPIAGITVASAVIGSANSATVRPAMKPVAICRKPISAEAAPAMCG